MGSFKTIREKQISEEIVEKKSRFIANLIYVESQEEAEENVKLIRKKYHDAKHNCFAYLIYKGDSIIKKFSDDGEPSGTAGAPMMEIIEKSNLGNVLVVVTRYFGGILLGTGGLVRAYSEVLKKAIQNATMVTLEPGFEVKIKTNYADLEKLKYYCNKNSIRIINVEYADIVECIIEVNDVEKDEIVSDMENENKLNILSFDIVRQKNVSVVSNKVD